MNAIEIRNLTKRFGEKIAVNNLNMTVPVGSIYGFIGENGSGKSTTEKLITGLLIPNEGSIKLFDKDYKDVNIRSQIGCLIEAPGAFPNSSIWNNMLLQASNLNIQNPKEEIARVLKIVRMEGAASNKFKNCSLGMKQRIGIAMALLGRPKLLILDEPINGLDADGMRIMREILVDITKTGTSVLISSHILSELEKIATHYGIIKNGKMIRELTAKQLDDECPTYIKIKSNDLLNTKLILNKKYQKVELTEDNIRIYDDNLKAEDVVKYLFENEVIIDEISSHKISLEEYYVSIMKEGI